MAANFKRLFFLNGRLGPAGWILLGRSFQVNRRMKPQKDRP